MQSETRRRRASWSLVLLVLGVCALAAPVVTWAQATTYRDEIVVPFDGTQFNPCTGDVVQITGELRISSKTTIDARGGMHSTYTLLPRNVRGVSIYDGTKYKAVGGERSSFNADADYAPLNSTFTSMFNFISQGGGANFKIKITSHYTIDAKGNLTADVYKYSSECSGGGDPYPAPYPAP
jgi:hypothetical protein